MGGTMDMSTGGGMSGGMGGDQASGGGMGGNQSSGGGNQQGGSGGGMESQLEQKGMQAAESFAKSKGW